MSAYRNALAVSAAASDERLTLAAEMLASGRGVVMLEAVVAVRSAGSHIRCEVVDPMPAARRCENEFEVLVENAQRMLESSTLGKVLPDLPREWLVVEDNGTGTVELWHAPR